MQISARMFGNLNKVVTFKAWDSEGHQWEQLYNITFDNFCNQELWLLFTHAGA